MTFKELKKTITERLGLYERWETHSGNFEELEQAMKQNDQEIISALEKYEKENNIK